MRYHRFLTAMANETWFIEPRRAQQIVEALNVRLANGPRMEPFLSPAEREANAVRAQVRGLPLGTSDGAQIAIVPMIGVVMPRGDAMEEMSGGASVNLAKIATDLRRIAADPSIRAVVLDVDSPGGNVAFVPEVAALIREIASDDRPVIAVANTMMCSAAYWLCAYATEIVASPSAIVGSVGVYQMHIDESAALEAEGVKVTYIYEGPRKVDGAPGLPLDDVSRSRMQRHVAEYYDMFTSDVAKGRGAPRSVVRADPEATDRHFGGGDALSAKEAVQQGLADRVGTLAEVIDGLVRSGGKYRKKRSRASIARQKVAMW